MKIRIKFRRNSIIDDIIDALHVHGRVCDEMPNQIFLTENEYKKMIDEDPGLKLKPIICDVPVFIGVNNEID